MERIVAGTSNQTTRLGLMDAVPPGSVIDCLAEAICLSVLAHRTPEHAVSLAGVLQMSYNEFLSGWESDVSANALNPNDGTP